MKNFVKGLGIGLGIAGVYLAAIILVPAAAFEWVVGLGPLTLLGIFFGYRLPEDNLKKWSTAHGVPITDDNRKLLVRHLTRGRRIRTAGALLGAYGYLGFTVEFGRDEMSWGILRSIFFGYLIGAGIAEVWALRLRPQGRPAAFLTPRAIRDYLPRPALYLLRASTVATIGLAVAWEWIPQGESIPGSAARPGVGWIAAWAGLSVAVTLFVEIVIRKIVKRPQPAVSDELLRADDAIRSSSIHQLAGAGLALALGVLSARLLGDIPDTLDRNKLLDVLQVIGMFAGVASIFSWLHLGVDQPWVVRRWRPQAKVAA